LRTTTVKQYYLILNYRIHVDNIKTHKQLIMPKANSKWDGM